MLFAITGIAILGTGAALVGLPILLHLIMRQEPKRLTFPAFRFLKQKRQINQRKIRIRHLLLLALRMALIALICLALWQPTVLSDGFSVGKGPVAAVIVIDTSPSMGYTLSERGGLTEARQRGLKLLGEPAEGPWTCLDEARGRIMEILEEMPSQSRVAIVDTADWSEPVFEISVADARQRIRNIKKTRANSKTVTRTLEGAYSLLSRADQDLEPGQEPLPRLLAVFSDRTTTSWDAARVPELQSSRDRVPPPPVFHVYVDVGIEKPVNTAITSIEMRPQIVPANQPAIINVTIESTTSTDNVLLFSVDGEEPQRIPVNPGPERPLVRQLRKDGLKPGLHVAKISLARNDALPFDDERTVTFRVREPRNVLVIVDPPRESLLTGALGVLGLAKAKAQVWVNALDAVGWYSCEVRAPDDPDQIDWGKYEQITLMGLRQPSPRLWKNVEAFVKRGGHLVVIPGWPDMDVNAYRGEDAEAVLPRRYTNWNQLPRDETATWTWDSLSPQRPLLTVFRNYRDQNTFFSISPPITFGYWNVEDGARERVVVSYAGASEADKRAPAVLEWSHGTGKIYQFTVPMDLGTENRVHNYAASWFYFVLANEAVRTLVGDSEDQTFNFTNGQMVLMKWPAGELKPGQSYILSGPDVTPADSIVKREAEQAFFRMGPEKTGSPGAFTLTPEGSKQGEGFSLNVPTEESNLERISPESILELFGPDAVLPADKKLPLSEILSGKFTQPIELFPFLMIVLLLVLAIENWMGNKFYRRKRLATTGRD